MFHLFFSILNSGLAFPDLEELLKKYQNPREADAMTKIQTDLDETKIILVRTCLYNTESRLQRVSLQQAHDCNEQISIKLVDCNVE